MRSGGVAACALWLLALSSLSLPAGEAAIPPASPAQAFQELYAAVEEAHLFADSKAFADATPRTAPQAILGAYRAEQPAGREALQAFVAAHFVLPVAASTPPALEAGKPIAEHVDQLWELLTRRTDSAPAYSSLLPVPDPYVVPGGRFRELYYWDSYFTMLGLLQSQRADLVADMVADFAELIDRYGHVPNGTRTYYLSRSQAPFFFEMTALLSPADPVAGYMRYLPELKAEYGYWMHGEAQLKAGTARRRVVALGDGSILNRYWDDLDTPRDESYAEDTALAAGSGRPAAPLYRELRAAAESGWDFSSRWLADGEHLATIETTSLVPVDLNSLLFGLERAISAACERAQQVGCAREFRQRAQRRQRAINHYLWDEVRGTYLDYQWPHQQRSSRVSAAMFYPLFEHLATRTQAARVARAAQVLMAPGGLATTLIASGQQWDAPNGWAPLQWIAIKALREHDQPAMARTIACRWLGTVHALYAMSGRLIEKYDVLEPGRSGGGGEYPLQDGFGWTNGVERALLALYPEEGSDARTAQCP